MISTIYLAMAASSDYIFAYVYIQIYIYTNLYTYIIKYLMKNTEDTGKCNRNNILKN